MTVALGIHCGHESSCAVVRDGVLLAAIQQERVTRRKYDGQEALTNRLPVREVLAAAGLALEDVDVVVSSFQAAGPSGVGLQRPLVSPSFDLFDPFDARHHVVSHHLAHAASAVYASGFPEAAVLVSDSAGTSSWDGADFHVPFGEFHRTYYSDAPTGPASRILTEMRSLYAFRQGRFELLERAFSEPHNQPDVFVQSEASLYDNVARFLFRKEHAHGQLMALAALPFEGPARLTADDIVTPGPRPRPRNGWQILEAATDITRNADIAHAVQEAFNRLVVAHAARAVALSGIPDLCCAGGVFLNLSGNTAIGALPQVRNLYVPSCPHDAGISVGAAYLGWAHASARAPRTPRPVSPRKVTSDFLGRSAEPITPREARHQGYAVAATADLSRRAAEVLLDGAVVVRYAGRAEFGPRALGNRSILCHPVACRNAKAKLNGIKKRQPWRPVAPMVRSEDLDTYFIGPGEAPFMNYDFEVREEHRAVLKEIVHDDGSARVQTVTADDNPAIHALLTHIAAMGQIPVLVNTSLNGPAQPIIESAPDVLAFARHADIGFVLTEDGLYASPTPRKIPVRRPDATVMAVFGAGGTTRYVLSNGGAHVTVGRDLFVSLLEQEYVLTDGTAADVAEALRAGVLAEA
ncbi:carbamoyltransferase C-terminal domain-containing protein [Streptomyces sp. NPDC003036]|uniref:carbamoyltransferase C-terminal domain-containing protein n=1 Tax=Streptomyces sp. NPDC003036 TaxID=3154442 RepID=UPI0033B772F9